MKKIFKLVFYLVIIGVIYNYRYDIVNAISSLLDSNHRVVLDEPNKYFKNKNYSYVKQSSNFIPYSMQDLINVYYSVLDRGYNDFTFYCPKEYENCISNIKKISTENSTFLKN